MARDPSGIFRADGRASSDTGKGGKLRLSRSLLFKKKPYDRPLSSRPHTASQSLPSRFVDSASNLISSSASFLFESFFKRRQTLWISNGVRPTVGTAFGGVEDGRHSPEQRPNKIVDKDSKEPALVENCEREDLDLAQIEGILKQQVLSREQVNRLTEVLQAQAVERNEYRSEITKQSEMIKKNGEEVTPVQLAKEEPSPVQLAKAYMGEHSSRLVPRQSSPHTQIEVAVSSSRSAVQGGMSRIQGGIAEPSPGSGFQGRIAASSFGSRSQGGITVPSLGSERREENRVSRPLSRARVPAADSVRMLKRRLIADDDDDTTVSEGRTRRVRQKMMLLTNISPYIRQVTAARGPYQKPIKQHLELGERPEKVLEVLEKPSSPHKGKSVEEPLPLTGAACYLEEPPESSKARENMATLHMVEKMLSTEEKSLVVPADEAGISSCEPAVGDATTSESKAIEKSSVPICELPSIVPEKSKGFHINAFFEESSSDEETGSPVNDLASIETQQLGALNMKAPPEVASRKQPFDCISNSGLSSIGADFTIKSSPLLLQPSVTDAPASTESSSLPITPFPEKAFVTELMPSTFAFTSAMEKAAPIMKPFPVFSQLPSATEKDSPALTCFSAAATSSADLQKSPSTTSPLLPSAATSSPNSDGATSRTSAVVAAAPFVTATTSQVGTAAPFEPKASDVEARPLQPLSTAKGVAQVASTSMPAFTVIASAPQLSELDPSVSLAEPAVVPAAVPSDVQGSTGAMIPASFIASEVPLNFVAAVDGVKADNRTSFASEITGADRVAELDTMATDPMTEEPDTLAVSSTASSFSFGFAITTPSTPMSQTQSFGTDAAPFSFSTQSSAPSVSSSSFSFPFASQSSTPAGQLFTFGASGASPANPFSSANVKPFAFGSSATSSASSMFTAIPSAPVTFPAPAPAPAAPSSIPFGLQAASTSSTSSIAAFEAPTANVFANTGAASVSPFSFTSSPASSGAPFQFGAGAVTSAPLSPSFTFGAQSTSAVANPFAASNVPAFQFGASGATPAQSMFSSRVNANATPSSTFPFGGQPAPSPAPFTFGAQAGAPPSGQAFGFGGQPAAQGQNPFAPSGQSPFPSAGSSGMDFAVGFSLGAAGSEKTGRKYIKAKRIGGAKRGK